MPLEVAPLPFGSDLPGRTVDAKQPFAVLDVGFNAIDKTIIAAKLGAGVMKAKAAQTGAS